MVVLTSVDLNLRDWVVLVICLVSWRAVPELGTAVELVEKVSVLFEP